MAATDQVSGLPAVSRYVHILENGGAETITLKHNVSSTAANRFNGPDGRDYPLISGAIAVATYDRSSNIWRLWGMTPPRFRATAFHSTTQTIATGTTTALSMDSADVDVGDMHDTVTNNSRVTIKADGYYLIVGFTFQDGATASGNLRCRKTGSATLATEYYAGVGTVRYSTAVDLVKDDYLENTITQNDATSTVYGHASERGYQSTLIVVHLW